MPTRNFGIVKHPGVGSSATATPKLPFLSPEDSNSSHEHETSSESGKTRRPSSTRNDSGTAQELLKSKGFIPINWHGKCEADKVSLGTYAVLPGQGGMYGLVFDNTFSKTTSKMATFVLLTYPSNAPPNTTHHHLQGAPGAMSSAVNIGIKGQSPRLGATPSDSVDSLHSHLAGSGSRGTSVAGRGDTESIPSTYHVGILQKRRRKRGQGYARRYFSLDFVSCTLSYYYNRNSSALRGAIPLSLAAIAADERRREISIDSGAEIWHLRASNARDFDEWTKALETASNVARGITSPMESSAARPQIRTNGLQGGSLQVNPEEEREWRQVESLVSRIVGTRDAIRRLAKDTNLSSKLSPPNFGPSSMGSSVPDDKGDYFGLNEKRPFWKRKTSSSTSTPRASDRSSQLAPTTVSTVSSNGSMASPFHRRGKPREEATMHDHCTALFSDLDSVLAEFSVLIASSKRRRMPAPGSAADSRKSMDSEADEFYDAEEDRSQLVMIQRQSEEDTPESEGDDEFLSDTSSISSIGEDDVVSPQLGAASLFPTKPKSFTPLPLKPVKHRINIPPATVLPPSLISFLRKNVGKDLSTISMPVSANEPISLLQRLAEALEYAALLDTASELKNPDQRLLHVAAFAVSYFANGRARERAIRKPFNPMLGETYELVRGDSETPGNFRFLAEKVSHRPVKMACQADSLNWSFSHSPVPTQKFWGKSAELITDGRFRVVLRLKDGTDECYSWTIATVFLRNIVMGEKYVEPFGTMTVVNETTGAKATIEFKSKGMFGGRIEDVSVESYCPDGSHSGLSLLGTWTSSLRLIEAGKGAGPEIWKAGKLVEGFETRYGLTEFAASLNEITEVERGKIAITDSRFRKDQRAAEIGKLDVAEVEKGRLEDEQRNRRNLLEAKGGMWKARWFTRVDTVEQGEEVWKLKGGKEGYWEERAKGVWTGVEDVLGVRGG
jgi:oxysterol-binding protein-related protein 3/6/7